MSSIPFPSTLDMNNDQLEEFRESCCVSHTILYRPGTRLCVGTEDDIHELEERKKILRAVEQGWISSNPYSSNQTMSRSFGTPRGVRPSVLLSVPYS